MVYRGVYDFGWVLFDPDLPSLTVSLTPDVLNDETYQFYLMTTYGAVVESTAISIKVLA